MSNLTASDRAPRFAALAPFFVFVIFYLGISLWTGDFYKVPMPIAFAVAGASALLMDHKRKFEERVDIFARGMGDVNIMLMCLIFVLAGIFATVAKEMHAVDAAVLISRHLIPPSLMLTGIFAVSCFISLAIGTSCGTIAALTPIAAGLVEPTGTSPAMMLGAVIGGAMFGDNMSMISDTTIAATRTQQVLMRDKFLMNLKMIFPAAIITAALYLCLGRSGEAPVNEAVTAQHIIAVAPYIIVLLGALFGMNVMALLFSGALLAACLGVCLGEFDFFGALEAAGKGALNMSETLIVAILAGGLLNVIRHNGGIGYLLNTVSRKVRTQRGCELGIFLLVALINLFTANNTVAIVIAGPIAKGLSDRFKCDPRRVASILDTGSCVIQGMIPYGAQLLIAAGVAKSAGLQIAPAALIGALFYPILLGIALLISILIRRK